MSERPADFIGAVRARRDINGIVLAETEYSSGLSISAHPHEEALCCLVLEGSLTERWGRRTAECDPGHLTYLPPDEPHLQEYHVDESRCFLIQISNPWMGRMQELGVTRPPDPGDLGDSRASWLASQLYGEFRTGDAAAALSIEGFALSMLGEIARTAMEPDRAPKPGWLLQAVELLHARAAGPVSMADIAGEVGVHPAHLARTFRDRYGSTMGEYLRRIRVERATGELTEGRKAISRIALDAGFSDQAHFTRVFKRFTGATPAAWRRARR